jgi:energy-coupling factor transport system ATP-binding protein
MCAAGESAPAPAGPDEAGAGAGAPAALPIIEADRLTYTYNPSLPDAVTAVNNMSFTVPEHCFLGIIGPTGCGKSTLITHFNGLIRPTSGRILINGQDIWEKPHDIRRFRFLTGLVFQYPEYQLFEETVEKDIAFGPKNMGLPEGEVKERVLEAARFCGLGPELLARSPFELSGGQKRRAAIAGVLAMRPRLLVLDEPASGLDPEGRDTILGMIKAYHKETGTSVVLVSHSMEDIAKYADRVLVMRDGGIAMYDTMPTVFARAAELLELGLSVPQITKIFLALKSRGVGIDTDIYTVKYAAEMVLRRLGPGAPRAEKEGGHAT